MYSRLPFFFALKAIACPIYNFFTLKSPEYETSITLNDRHYPKDTQNYLDRAGFKLEILLTFKTSIEALILSNF